MKRKLIVSIIAALLSTHAYADTASIVGSGMGLLENEWVKAGVNANTGTLGSGGGTSPGLLFDKDGTGTFNAGYDYLTPGSPFDGFSLKVDSDNKTNNNTGTEQIAGQGVTLSNSNQTLSWSGSATYGSATWNLTNAYTLAPNTPYIDITTTIVAGSAATNVYFAKFIDPDSQGMAGDSSSTDNVLGYGAIPSTNVAFSEATVSRYALGLYSSATNVAAGINGWSTDAASYVNADASCGTGILYCNADDTIGLTFHWTSVTAGSTLTASYAYIFGPSAFGAASSAVTGGAGGGTPGTAPGGGTLVDVGSATDAATSGGSTPTVVSTATVNGTASFADLNGDSVVIATSSIAGDFLTRNYNSLTTTEVGRTTTTPRTIVTTWTSGPDTSAATTSLVVPENYFHAVDVTHSDVATSAVADAASRTHVDTGSVTLDTPDVTASADYSTRTGFNATSGTIARETTTPTLFTYGRTTVTVTTNDFAASSVYSDTSSTATTTSTVNATYNVITNEDFTRTVTKDVLDIMTASEAYAPYTRVSNGLHGSIAGVDSAILTATTSKDITLTAHTNYSALERFTKTTPTTFTYDRVVTTSTLDRFGLDSVYTNALIPTQTTASSVVTGNYDVITTEYDPLSARVDYNLTARTDQGKVITDVHSLINRNTEFGRSINYKFYDHGIAGYSGHSNQFGIGYTKDIAGDMDLGIGINKINTSMSGHKSNMNTDAVQIGATLSKEVNGFNLKATAQHSWIDYKLGATPTLSITGSGDSRLLPSYAIVGTRTVDAGSISTSPSGTDTSVMFRATGPGTYIRPVVGAMLGYRKVDSYTTRWDIAPGLRVEERTGKESDTYSFATVGAQVKYNMFNATALIHTDGVKQYGLGLEKSADKVTFNLRADRLETKDGGSNLYTANMIYMF
jgi:hypothetical protein